MNPHAWTLADLDTIPRNGIKVMSTFACGGGSSMGYKRAGCEIVAANDIDPEMAWHYKRNINPPHYFLMPIRELLTADLPPALMAIDILDGSPPCSTFSMSGSREKDWGKDKHFREGQATQVLSDLFFDWLDVVGRLRPKVAIAENVKGLVLGNAKGYVRQIMNRLREFGYRPQVFLVNAADCGVPQRRERVFFCAVRDDIQAPPLKLSQSHRWVSAGEACADLQDLTAAEYEYTAPIPTHERFWHGTLPGQSFSSECMRQRGVGSFFNFVRLNAKLPAVTIPAHSGVITHWSQCRTLTLREYIRLGSFPDDYIAKDHKLGMYLVGMSVPPKMAEAVARAVCTQWLGVTYADVPADRDG